jgi:peptidoglycan/LPS O-acetylase OafA/YrhL
MARRMHLVRLMSDSPTSIRDAGAPLGERFLLLDGLRGVAAFAVILDHVPGGWLGDLIPGRYLAVDFFFVLSGFVLAHAYGRGLDAGGSALAFMKARVIRLYPMYLLGLAIALSPLVLGAARGWIGPGWGDILTVAVFGLLLLPAPVPAGYGDGALYPANAPAWSLFFELIANVVYALIARVLSWRVLGAILGVSAAAVAFTIARHGDVRGPGWMWAHFEAGLARVMFGFFAGVAIYRLRAVLKLPALPWWAAVAALLAVIAAAPVGPWRVAYDVAAALVLMPVLVAVASAGVVTGVVGRLCAISGLLSYGVYVLHVPLLALIRTAAAVAGVQLGEGPLLALAIALSAGAAAWVANSLYDGPARRWLSGRARRARPFAAAREQG